VRLLALTCGVTVASIYYAQPLLVAIARDLAVEQSAAGLVVTANQVGFAAGLVFVVPLGDIIARRPLFTALLGWPAVRRHERPALAADPATQ
jgi:predicted MFS family arabinose efflux permease